MGAPADSLILGWRPGRMELSTCLAVSRMMLPSRGSPLTSVLVKFMRLLERDVRRQRRHFGIRLDLEDDRAVGCQRLIPRRAQRVRPIHVDAVQSDQLGEAVIGDVRDVLRGIEFGIALHDALLPGDLVQILVVEDATIQRGSAHCRQYFATVISSAMLFICMAPSPTSAMTGRSGWANLAAMA